MRSFEPEISAASQFVSWLWSGSRYSGLMCMAVCSTIYFTMEVVTDVFSVQPIPLLEVAFMRCTVMLVLSYMWLRKVEQPFSGLGNATHLLISRAFTGFISLVSFIYCIQRLSLSQAIVLSLTTPIIASVAARFILHETYKVSEIGGLVVSFFGVLFIFWQFLTTQDTEDKTHVTESGPIYAILAGSLSALSGGINCCLIRAGAKASDQPLLTVFSFSWLASPAAGICLFSFEAFVLPTFYSFSLMLVLGVLVFSAEVFLARGLHLEKTSKVANIIYMQVMQVALSQLRVIGFASIAPTFGRIFGCLLILISVFCTVYWT